MKGTAVLSVGSMRGSSIRARARVAGRPALWLLYQELLWAIYENGGRLCADPRAIADEVELFTPEEIGELLPLLLVEVNGEGLATDGSWIWCPALPRYIRRRVRAHISRGVRFAVYARDGWCCRSCGEQGRLSLDHVVPFSRGGSDTIANLQTLCLPCNIRKGAQA